MTRFDLAEKTAVVIGGTGVLGGAIASGLAAAGAQVVVIGRNTNRGQERVDVIQTAGHKAHYIPCDATNADALKTAHKQINNRFGPVHILLNAAGGNDPRVTVNAERTFEQIKREDWLANFDLNLIGGILLPCQEFGPAMVQHQEGSIINIASITAHIPLSGVVAYSAAKAAVLSLTQFLAREWAPAGVRVNSITPGFFPAQQNRRLLYNEDGSPSPRGEQILAHTPMARFGKPEELVGTAVFLACDAASSFITGSDIRVDGGFLSTTI